MSVTRLPTATDVAEEESGSCYICPESVRRILTTMLDLSLLKSPSFLILAISGGLTMMGFYTPFMYVPGIVSRFIESFFRGFGRLLKRIYSLTFRDFWKIRPDKNIFYPPFASTMWIFIFSNILTDQEPSNDLNLYVLIYWNFLQFFKVIV